MIASTWIIKLVGVWRDGVAEIVLDLGLFRGPAISAKTYRIATTLGLSATAIVCGALLAGFWGPISRPSFERAAVQSVEQ